MHTDWQCPLSRHYTARLDSNVCGANDGVSTNISGSIFLANTSNIRIELCTIMHIGGHGIFIGDNAQNTTILRTLISESAIGAIRIEGSGNVVGTNISDCVLRDGGKVFPQGTGVRIEGRVNSPWPGRPFKPGCPGCPGAGNTTISWTEITNFHGKGIVMRESNCNIVERCHIHDLVHGILSDKGFVQNAAGGEGTIWRQNVMHGIYGYFSDTAGLYLDSFSNNTLIEQNVIYHAGEKGSFLQHWGKGNRIRSNLLINLPHPRSHCAARTGAGSDYGCSMIMTEPIGYGRTSESPWPNEFEFSSNILYTPLSTGHQNMFDPAASAAMYVTRKQF